MIAKLGGSSAENYYYEKDPIFNENGDGQNLSWGGKAAQDLGLQGNSGRDDFKDILNGKYKDTELRNSSQHKTGEERKSFDLVLSAPKSVSHAALVLGDERVIRAHDDAVKTAMDKAESTSQARVTKDGLRRKENTGKMLYAQAKHSTSRATPGHMPDPSLHTHNIIMNATKDQDGNWKSLNSDQLFKSQAVILQTYKQELAHNLKEQGFGVNFDSKGNFEISGYKAEVVDNFSKRKMEIERQVSKMKEDPKYAGKSDKDLRDYAQHNLKSDKFEVTKEELIKDWKDQHREKGLDSLEKIQKDINDGGKDKTRLSVDQVLKITVESLTDKESHFSKDDLLKAAFKVNKGDNKTADIEKAINGVKKIGQKHEHDLKKITVDGKERFTSKKIFDIEKENVKILQKDTQKEALLTKEQANKGLDAFEKEMGWEMTRSQREAAFNSLTSTSQFISIQGDAGTGKTTMLDAIRHTVEFNNYNSDGLGVLAPTGKAAAGAQEESGIKGQTVDSYLMNRSSGNNKDDTKTFTMGETTTKAFKDEIKKSFTSYSPDFKKAFMSDKDVKTAFGISKTIDGSLKKSTSHKSYDKNTQTFKHSKTEVVTTGKFKGSKKHSTFKSNGENFISKEKTILNDGRRMEKESKIYSPLGGRASRILSVKSETSSKSQKTGLLSSIKKEENEKSSISFLGIKRSSEKTKIFDEKGKLQEVRATTGYSFIGRSFGAETKVQTSSMMNKNFTKDEKTGAMSQKAEIKPNKEDLNKVDKSIDKSLDDKEKKGSMIFIDESSMLSSEKLNGLLKDAEKHGHKIAFIGDTKQLLAVQQGKAFNEVQTATSSTHMNEGMRQRSTPQAKAVVDLLAKGDIKGGVEKLDAQGGVKEKSKEASINDISSALAKDRGYKDTIGLASSKKAVKEINSATREKIFGKADFGKEASVKVDKNLGLIEKMNASSYDKGDKVSIEKGGRFSEYGVKDIDKEKGKLTLSSDKKTFTVDLKKEAQKIKAVASIEKRSFVVGDKVMNLKNDKNLGTVDGKVKGTMNGEVGYVTGINKGKMTVDFDGKQAVFDLKKENSIDHAYAMTVHKSQGVTSKGALVFLDTKNRGMNNSNAAYVAMSRHKESLTLFTDDRDKLLDQITSRQEKTSTVNSSESKQELLKEEVKTDDRADSQDQAKIDDKVDDKVDDKSNAKMDIKTYDNDEIAKELVKEKDDSKDVKADSKGQAVAKEDKSEEKIEEKLR